MTDHIMTSKVTLHIIGTCVYCGGLAPFGNAAHAMCLTCLYACHDCGVILDPDNDTHYCQSCHEDRTYAAWDKTQP